MLILLLFFSFFFSFCLPQPELATVREIFVLVFFLVLFLLFLGVCDRLLPNLRGNPILVSWMVHAESISAFWHSPVMKGGTD